MLLRSYGFNQSVDDVWILFKAADETKEFDCSLELIDAALDGRIDISKYQEDDENEGKEKKFNLQAYTYAVKKTRRLEKNRKAKDLKHIIDENEEFGSGVSADRVSMYAESSDEYQKILDEDEVSYAVDQFNKMCYEVLIEMQIDLKHTIRMALLGMPESIRLVKKVVDSYWFVEELVKIILGSGYSFEELFGEGGDTGW